MFLETVLTYLEKPQRAPSFVAALNERFTGKLLDIDSQLAARGRPIAQALATFGVLYVLTFVAGCHPKQAPKMHTNAEPRADRLARVIREYDAQGVHRTGTDVDSASARWLAKLVAEAGFEATLQALPFERIDTKSAFLEVTETDGTLTRYDGIPLMDCAEYTGADGITGQLGGPDTDAKIVVACWPPSVQYVPAFRQIRTSVRHSALVVVTGGKDFDRPPDSPQRAGLPEGYALINADRYLDPYGHPVLQLPSTAGAALVIARQRSAQARLVMHIERTPVKVFNVTTTVLGTDVSAAPVVVMTPRSGWWEVASERGGGIALWVELLHAIHQSQPQRTVLFVASTGHELGHVGLHHYLKQHSDLVEDAHLWFHLGANFAAAVGGNIRVQASSQALLDRALAAMKREGIAPGVITPVTDRPYGEAREIYDGGGSFLSLLGSNGLFHSPDDRWPDSVEMETLKRLTDAYVSLLTEVANDPAP